MAHKARRNLSRRITRGPRILLVLSTSILMMLAVVSNSHAQLRDTTTAANNMGIDSTVLCQNSNLTVGVAALQFLAGEVAFNASSFALGGNELYHGSQALGGGKGVVLALFTVPLAIHYITRAFGKHEGYWLLGSLAGFVGFFFTPPGTTYQSRYLATSLPIILGAMIAYDLTAWALE